MRLHFLAVSSLLLGICVAGCADPSSPYVCEQKNASEVDRLNNGDGGAPDAGNIADPPNQCPALPAGVDVGFASCNQLGDLVLKDCDGSDYPLTNLCGATGVWIFAAYAWCPACQSVSLAQEGVHDKYKSRGLRSVNVILQKADYTAPDASYCKTWQDKFNLADVTTLYDPTGGSLVLWPSGSTSLSAFVNRDRVIVDKLVQNSNVDDIEASIERALAP